MLPTTSPLLLFWTSAVALIAISLSATAAAATNGTVTINHTNATKTAPEEIGVHVLERYLPFQSKTIVGAYSAAAEDPGYRLIKSFKAYAFTTASAVSMDCYAVARDSGKWTPLATKMTRSRDPTFCVRRDLPKNGSQLVAQFERNDTTALLIATSADDLPMLVANTKRRGWTTPPLVSFRVHKVKNWQNPPGLLLFTDVQVVVAPTGHEAQKLCRPDPRGLVYREIHGGDYNVDVKENGTQVQMLCNSYTERSLQDIQPKETFIANLAWSRCADLLNYDRDFVSVKEVKTGKAASFKLPSSEYAQLRYERFSLLTKPSHSFVKYAFVGDASEYSERLHIQFHPKNAWAFPDKKPNEDKVNQF